MPVAGTDALALAFGTRLRTARVRSGISQEALADLAGMSRDGIGRLETGQRMPRLDTIVALSAALEIDPADLLRGLRA